MKQLIIKDCLKNALFALLKTKRLQEITVSELVKKAGVSRASFYRSYYLTEDILRDYLKDVFERIYLVTPESLSGLDLQICSFFDELFKEKERLTLLNERGLLYLLDNPVYQFCLSQLKNFGKDDDKYKCALYAGSSCFLIRAWIKNDFDISSEDLMTLSLRTFSIDGKKIQ